MALTLPHRPESLRCIARKCICVLRATKCISREHVAARVCATVPDGHSNVWLYGNCFAYRDTLICLAGDDKDGLRDCNATVQQSR